MISEKRQSKIHLVTRSTQYFPKQNEKSFLKLLQLHVRQICLGPLEFANSPACREGNFRECLDWGLGPSVCLPPSPPWPSVLYLLSLACVLCLLVTESPWFSDSWSWTLSWKRDLRLSEPILSLSRWEQCSPERKIELTCWISCKGSLNSKGRTGTQAPEY